jgi:hypothetical protein
MPCGFDFCIREALLEFPIGYVADELSDPCDVEIRGVKIWRLIPGYAVILERRGDEKQRAEKERDRN